MTKTTALLAKYLGLFEKNPTGQVFAPLAETYRKLGMYKEAMDVLKKGLRHHPHYVLGLIVLAHCHFDQGHLEQAYRILSPIVNQEQDNLMLQKLFAQISYKLYAYKDALNAYKNVLFVNPTDEEAKIKIKELEEQEQNYYAYMNKNSAPLEVEKKIEAPVKKNLSMEDVSAWKSLEQQESIPEKILETEEKNISEYLKEVPVDDAQAWTIKQWSVSNDSTPKVEIPQKITLKDSIIEDVIPEEEIPAPIENPSQTNNSNNSINLDSYQNISPTEEIPIVTHTLIDIFCAQKHYDKALELLDKVIKHDPTDERSIQKKQYVLSKMQDSKPTAVKKSIPTPVVPVEVLPKTKPTETTWNEAKYNMLSQRYGKLLDHLKDLGKSL
jgi:pentatricopeptide repeat protein